VPEIQVPFQKFELMSALLGLQKSMSSKCLVIGVTSYCIWDNYNVLMIISAPEHFISQHK